MTDPSDVLDAIDDARDAFEFRTMMIEFEDGIEDGENWKTQLTKACRYLGACRELRAADGYNGAVIELSFSAVERTVEAYLLWESGNTPADFLDHETAYDRAGQRGLFTRETAEELKQLYSGNRTEHYYGSAVPTQQKDDAMFDLAGAIHAYTVQQIPVGGVCRCETGRS